MGPGPLDLQSDKLPTVLCGAVNLGGWVDAKNIFQNMDMLHIKLKGKNLQ